MLNFLKDKKVIIGITGSVAAYKTLDLIRQLKKANARIKVVLTDAAKAFVAPLSIQALTGEPVFEHFIDADQEAAMGHIELARWADYLLIAPASANSLAKLTHGQADDLLSTLYLATHAPLLVAPAMNMHMWQHPATQQNVATLKARGVHFLGPEYGEQACGDIGPGRMMEPEALCIALHKFIGEKQPILAQGHVVITAGPTQEPIDPVRYLSNHSSGKMGYALAAALQATGLKVTLISGPTQLTTPAGVNRIDVTTAKEMHQVVMETIETCDIFIGCAAVADYHVKAVSRQKMKKHGSSLMLELCENPDIIQNVASLEHPPLVVGFAAETQNVIEYATSKLQQKQLDMIIANDVSDDQVFGQDSNQASLISKENLTPVYFPRMPKSELAAKLVHHILKYRETHSASAEATA